MMISDLPSGILEEILFRVPATCLGKSRFTCKRWKALVEDPTFIKKHFDKAARQSIVVTQMYYEAYSTSLNLDGIQNNVVPVIEFTNRLGLINPRRNAEICVSQVFHCEGFLLCVTMDRLLAVWNPCTGQTVWVKAREPYESYDTYALGYTNNKVGRSYKIVRHFNFTRRMEIYEFCSNSWRVLDDSNCNILSCSVSLSGHIYWLASYEHVQVNGIRDLLLRLEFSSEKFRYLPLPQTRCAGHSSLAVVRDEQLAALNWGCYNTDEIQIWVSTKIETTNVSWSNFLKVSLLTIPWVNGYNANFYIDYDKKVVGCSGVHGGLTTNLVHIIGNKEHAFREISLGEYPNLFRQPVTFHYVPSLVRFQEGAGRSGHKRKRT